MNCRDCPKLLRTCRRILSLISKVEQDEPNWKDE